MSKVFLSHSSFDKDSYVNIVANQLIKKIGENNIILDSVSFQEGRRTTEEIYNKLDNTDLFAIFISEHSLNSNWVNTELVRIKELIDNGNIIEFFPLIIDSTITHNDFRIPSWLLENYNIQNIRRPTKATQLISQRMIEISYEKHPRLKERDEIFVGRNEYLKDFEERMDDFYKPTPKVIIASGIKSIGRTKLVGKCLSKSNIVRNTHQFPILSLSFTDSIEDMILKLYDLGLEKCFELTDFLHKPMPEKEGYLVQLIKQLQEQQEIVFFEDSGCIINHEGDISEWFKNVIFNTELSDKITFCIISKFRYIKRDFSELFQNFYSMEVSELTHLERNGLLKRLSDFEQLNLEIDDMRTIGALLSGYPEQIFYTVEILKNKGIDFLKKNLNMIPEFNEQKASILTSEFADDKIKMEILTLLSSFDCISMNFIFQIIEDSTFNHMVISEFITKSICEYMGIDKEYIRVNETIKDYILRSSFKIPEHFRNKLSSHLDSFLLTLDSEEYDMPQFLFTLKEAIRENKKIDEKYLVPSLYLKTMNESYYSGKYKDVISFADKALINIQYMDDRIVFEIRYLLCSALAKLRNKRFLKEVQLIRGADHHFLLGFYYRQIYRFDKALEQLNESMIKRPNFSKAKREIVQVYISMQEYSVATELAKENYLNYKNNAYHIQAYFTCVIRSEKSEVNRSILEELISKLENINSEMATEMLLRCRAQFEAYYNENSKESLRLINEAIDKHPEIQYSRLAKFEICDKFDEIDDMKEILSFFEQEEFNQRYQNNIVYFKSIIMAKEGNVEQATKYFVENIKNYTDQAIDKIKLRLLRYKSN